jgi:hypothetical protein
VSRPKKTTTPSEILAQDGRQKAILTPHTNMIIADYYSLAGAANGTSSYWKWDRRAEVRMQPPAAALVVIQRIVDTPFPKRR